MEFSLERGLLSRKSGMPMRAIGPYEKPFCDGLASRIAQAESRVNPWLAAISLRV